MQQENNNIITRLEEQFLKSNIFHECNKVFVSGTIEEDFEFSYRLYDQNFYKMRLRITRLSGTEDFIPIIASELLIGNKLASNKGKMIEIAGQLKSYMNKGHKELFLHAKQINICDNESELKECKNSNAIYLEGYICEKPKILGNEGQVTSFQIAVNVAFGKAEYIPCTAWGKEAKWIINRKIGEKISLYGRVQSRIFYKKETDLMKIKPIEVYEVTVRTVDLAKN